MIRPSLDAARRFLKRVRAGIVPPRRAPGAGARAGSPDVPAEAPVLQRVRSGPDGTGRTFTRVSAATMLPPWDRHPDIPLGSIGWRMGEGEEYLISFRDWFGRRALDEKARYAATHPEPPDWHGFYVRSGLTRVDGPLS